MRYKPLIGTRGEMACWVVRAANQIGLNTVAAYSEADADAIIDGARAIELAREHILAPRCAVRARLIVEHPAKIVSQSPVSISMRRLPKSLACSSTARSLNTFFHHQPMWMKVTAHSEFRGRGGPTLAKSTTKAEEPADRETEEE
jgi:hypothetical protein